MWCKSCRFHYDGEANFCPRDGTELIPEDILCPGCENIIYLTDKFCKYCGKQNENYIGE